MRFLFLFFLLFTGFTNFAQELLVPYRVGNLFGLSDVKAKVKVKPAYDYVEPIGEGYFKYSNYTKVQDTIHWASGRIEIKQKTFVETGVFFNKKLIIQNSKHRHFTVVKNAMLIGSEESYISKNSNFYNLNGKRLLEFNVEKFRFLNSNVLKKSMDPVIAIFAEHFDKTASIFLYDTKKQELLPELLSKVQNIEFDRHTSSEERMIFSYNDDQYNYYKMEIYFDEHKNTFVKIPFVEENRNNNRDLLGNGTEMINIPPNVRVPEPTRSVSDDKKPTTSTAKREIPKKIYSFIKVNDSLVKYNETEIRLAPGEKIFFAERGAKNQRQPLIFTAGEKKGLLFSDSLRSEKLFDSLRYIKNQYGPFTSSFNYIYLAGKKNENGNWQYGVIDEKGKILIPIIYEYLSPNLPEIYLENNNDIMADSFSFRQPYNYSNDKNALLTLYKESVFLAKMNGMFGVINLYDSTLLPFIYDEIWKNGFSFLKTLKVEEDFYVYRKGVLHGVFNLSSIGITNDTGLKFPKVPVYAYRNYMGIKDFTIFNLATPADLYFCLATKEGTVYFRPK